MKDLKSLNRKSSEFYLAYRDNVQDVMDPLISRSLKNWAARHSPPRDGKARLLQAAQSPLPPVKRFFGRIWLDQLLSYEVQLRSFEDGVMTVPMMQSRLWSFNITLSFCFMT